MNKILTITEATLLSEKLHAEKKSIVLTGGYFDILHIGHVALLTEAKKHGDVLFVLLESDDAAKKNKGNDRPIHLQKDRATILAAMSSVDYVVCLTHVMENQEYDELIRSIKPTVLATTTGDPSRLHKERQASLVNAKVIDVVDTIPNKSTTRIANIISESSL